MGDNSLDWVSLLGALSDSDELMPLLTNEVKAENPENDQLQQSSKILLQSAMLPYQNLHVVRDVEPGSSSCLTQNLQNASGTGMGSSQQLLILNDLPTNKRMRKKIQDATEEAEQRKKMNKIKNRISAAKSRAERQEHTKFLEERVEQLRNENAYLKKLLFLENAVREQRFPEEGEEIELKRQTNGLKLEGCIRD